MRGKTRDTDQDDGCNRALASVLESHDLTAESYAAKTPKEKAAFAVSVRNGMEEKYRLQPDDRKLTHAEFVKVAAEWKTNKRITGMTYKWVEDRHVLAAATAADIPLLLSETCRAHTPGASTFSTASYTKQ